MSAIYELFILDEIIPELSVNYPKATNGDVVVLDASNSRFAGSGSSDGLLYRWNCPRKI